MDGMGVRCLILVPFVVFGFDAVMKELWETGGRGGEG